MNWEPPCGRRTEQAPWRGGERRGRRPHGEEGGGQGLGPVGRTGRTEQAPWEEGRRTEQAPGEDEEDRAGPLGQRGRTEQAPCGEGGEQLVLVRTGVCPLGSMLSWVFLAI